MWTKEEKEVTELLFCKQIISILIVSSIEFLISKKKPRFDVLIENHNCNEIKNTFLSYLPMITKNLDFIILSFAFGTMQRNSIYSYISLNIYRIHQRNRQQRDNWYAFSISVKLKLFMWFWDQIEISFPFQQNNKSTYNK